VHLVPPELLLTEKFTAARGRDLQKFDLFDAAALAMTQPIDCSLLQRIIEAQSFRPQHETLPAAGGLEDCISDVRLRSILSARLGSQPNASFEFHPTADNLKRAAFVEALLRGLDSAMSEADTPQPLEPRPASLNDIFGAEAVREKLESLKGFLYHYAEFQLGRADYYVKRRPGQKTDVLPGAKASVAPNQQ
jgi:hypothetical protein